jgi:hypothetical protein
MTPAANHRRILPSPTGPKLTTTAGCTCGWRSKPCTNAEFANQAWERHKAEVSATNAEHDDEE